MLGLQFCSGRLFLQFSVIQFVLVSGLLGTVVAVLLGVHHDVVGVLRLEVVTHTGLTLTIRAQMYNKAVLMIILLRDGTSAFEAQLTQTTEFDAELIAFTLVIAQLDDAELGHLLGGDLLGLHPLDAVETSHKADHVMLKELDELRVQRWHVARLISAAFLPVRILSRVLLLLQPAELIGNEAVLVQ